MAKLGKNRHPHRAGAQQFVGSAELRPHAMEFYGENAGYFHSNRLREMDAVVENGYVIVGSPDEMVEQLRAVATDLHVGHPMLRRPGHIKPV